jgi:hypothetical protein
MDPEFIRILDRSINHSPPNGKNIHMKQMTMVGISNALFKKEIYDKY